MRVAAVHAISQVSLVVSVQSALRAKKERRNTKHEVSSLSSKIRDKLAFYKKKNH